MNPVRIALVVGAFQALALRPAHEPRKITVYPPKGSQPQTKADHDRAAAAQAKRDRKANKRRHDSMEKIK